MQFALFLSPFIIIIIISFLLSHFDIKIILFIVYFFIVCLLFASVWMNFWTISPFFHAVGWNRYLTIPFLSIKNFSKFHVISFARIGSYIISDGFPIVFTVWGHESWKIAKWNYVPMQQIQRNICLLPISNSAIKPNFFFAFFFQNLGQIFNKKININPKFLAFHL